MTMTFITELIKRLDAQQPGWERTFAHPSDVQDALASAASGEHHAVITGNLKEATAPRLLAVGRAVCETINATAHLTDQMKFWKALTDAAGCWQDGSQTDVALLQDDATHQCIIKIGTDDPRRQRFAKRYYGATFEAAMAEYLREQTTQGEPK